VVWFTGLSGAGKSAIAREVERRLWLEGRSTMLLDGDQVRHGLSGDLGFSRRDRSENIRRIGEVARLFFEHGEIVLCTFVSPYREDRERVRSLLPQGRFIEVHVAVDLEEAKSRDPKGLYQLHAKGEIRGLTGIDEPYEPSPSVEIAIDTNTMSEDEAVERVLDYLRKALELN
jgi:bifunctional enzyme CysN/CysC